MRRAVVDGICASVKQCGKRVGQAPEARLVALLGKRRAGNGELGNSELIGNGEAAHFPRAVSPSWLPLGHWGRCPTGQRRVEISGIRARADLPSGAVACICSELVRGWDSDVPQLRQAQQDQRRQQRQQRQQDQQHGDARERSTSELLGAALPRPGRARASPVQPHLLTAAAGCQGH